MAQNVYYDCEDYFAWICANNLLCIDRLLSDRVLVEESKASYRQIQEVEISPHSESKYSITFACELPSPQLYFIYIKGDFTRKFRRTKSYYVHCLKTFK